MENFFISNKDIKLEAEYFQSTSVSKSVILVFHPHPQFGGNMHNNVVSGVFKTFVNNNISSLRFNFRAVGRSNGTHSTGRGELSDGQSCLDYLINEKKMERIFLCGYSYGAAIGCSTINHSDKIIGYAAISLPWDVMGPKYKKLSQTHKPKLFIQGDRDDVAQYANFEKHYDSYDKPKESIIVKGADHFYWGYEEQVANKILEFYMKLE